jgi:DNA end-binding protein Ku
MGVIGAAFVRGRGTNGESRWNRRVRVTFAEGGRRCEQRVGGHRRFMRHRGISPMPMLSVTAGRYRSAFFRARSRFAWPDALIRIISGTGIRGSALAARANWKGFLKIGDLTCPVALYTATSTSNRITFHTINRATGHRVHREFVDSETGKTVGKEDQVKGYEIGSGEYIVLEPEEVAEAVPVSDKTLSVATFVRCRDIDDVYFDKAYYLAPADPNGEEVFVLLRDGMRRQQVAALAQTVLFRRARNLLVHACGEGLMATTLHAPYEVRSAEEAFSSVPDLTIKGEMLELAQHIIRTKAGRFDPTGFDDRYEAALAELVKAKMSGETLPVRKVKGAAPVVDLMAALRESAGMTGKKPAAKGRSTRTKAKGAAPRRKAG